MGRKEELHFERQAIDVVISKWMRLCKEQLIACTLESEATVILDSTQQFPWITAIGNKLSH